VRYSHDEIREMLPEYINGTLRKDVVDEIKTHLDGCAECREEASVLSAIKDIDIPDPGDLFWNTLPKKIGGIAAERKKRRAPLSWLLRPVPVMVSLLLLMTLTFILLRPTNTNEIDPLFEDPLTYSSIEINGITEDDVLSLLAQEMDIKDVDVYIGEDIYSYYTEIASLSSAELQGLYEALQKEQTKGG
jgi:hypothetical protein